MLILYTSGGSQEFEINWMSSPFGEDEILRNTCKLLVARGLLKAAEILAANNFRILKGTNNFNDEFYVLRATRTTELYEQWRRLLLPDNEHNKVFKQVFSDIADVINEMRFSDPIFGQLIYVRFVICDYEMYDGQGEDDDWRRAYLLGQSNTNNQALFNFPDSSKLSKYGLHFRSKTEIKMYEALVKRGLFILPLPVAILGDHKSRREPDFVVAYQGKIGILEIHGEKWHPAETYAKEAERRRHMRNLGVSVYEVFDAQRCWQETESVIDEFLKAFTIG